jgi:hypothetical protein
MLEILSDYEKELDTLLMQIVEVIPAGWQFPEECFAEIRRP